jgi:hypothetical protein
MIDFMIFSIDNVREFVAAVDWWLWHEGLLTDENDLV